MKEKEAKFSMNQERKIAIQKPAYALSKWTNKRH